VEAAGSFVDDVSEMLNSTQPVKRFSDHSETWQREGGTKKFQTAILTRDQRTTLTITSVTLGSGIRVSSPRPTLAGRAAKRCRTARSH